MGVRRAVYAFPLGGLSRGDGQSLERLGGMGSVCLPQVLSILPWSIPPEAFHSASDGPPSLEPPPSLRNPAQSRPRKGASAAGVEAGRSKILTPYPGFWQPAGGPRGPGNSPELGGFFWLWIPSLSISTHLPAPQFPALEKGKIIILTSPAML